MFNIGKLSDEDLMKDEQIQIIQYPAWYSEIKTIITAFISLGLASVSAYYLFTNTAEQYLYIIPGVFLAVSILLALDAWVAHKTILYAATSFRIIKKTGIFRKQIDYVPYSKIQNVSLRKGFIGSVLDMGDILIDVAGSPNVEVKIHNINDPERFQRILMENMQKRESA